MKMTLTIFMIILSSFDVLASDAEPVSKISAAFQFDGKVEANEWEHVAPLNMTVRSPSYGAEPTERTVIKLAYDENYIYLSGALYDSEPHKILANAKERDGGSPSTGWFGMVIDSYNDKQNSLGFFTTPSGNRFDASISGDAQGRNPMNISWNNFWDVKVSTTDEGWFAEMRIPFSSLPYQLKDGKATMGITTWRYIARKNEMHICPDISPDTGEMGTWRPSEAQEYVFEGINQKKPFYITPYVLGGASSTYTLNDNESAYNRTTDIERNVGLDIKYGLTNNFTLDLTVNTDFAQVEVDDQQINLSRFSLFFPEKRLFFQERAGIFNFSLGSRDNLFYSRRIGIDEDGNPIPILAGARITGRKGDMDIGIISMQTRGIDDFASNNYSVFRVKKRIINENSDLGLLVTNNFDVDGNYNTVYGVDSRIRVFSDSYLSLKFAQSITSEVESKVLSSDPSIFWISMSRLGNRGFAYGASLSRLGKDFQNNIGFNSRSDYTRLGTRFGYNWYPGKASKLLRHGLGLRGASYWDNQDDKYNQGFYGFGYQMEFKSGWFFDGGMRLQFDDIKTEFDLADIVIIPVGEYTYPSLDIEAGTPFNKPLSLAVEFQSGKFYDGRKTTIGLEPLFNVSSSLELSATYEYNKVNFDVRNQSFKTHIARIKALYMFSTKFSVSSFIQYNSLADIYLGNIRMRYNPKEGNDLFIVFNSDVNASRGLESPTLPAYNQGTLLIKYSYTFVR